MVIISVNAIIPEAQSNTNAQQKNIKQIADSIAILFVETLNNIQKGLVALPKEETDLEFFYMNSRDECNSIFCYPSSIRAMVRAQKAWRASHPNAPKGASSK